MKKKTSVAPGLYRDELGRFWARPWVHHRRTWRKLDAVTVKAALKEALNLEAAKLLRFDELAKLYLDAGCPNNRLEPRPEKGQKAARKQMPHLLAYFGLYQCDEITLPRLPGYAEWRLRRIKQGRGQPTVDINLQALSNVLNYGVAAGLIKLNHIAQNRPQYNDPTQTRHARQVAPKDADQVHEIARSFFRRKCGDTIAWQLLFAMFTGCRTSELLRLRVDAKNPDDAGFVMDGCLFLGRRSKGGVNPWAMIGPEFEEMLKTFRKWHAARHPASPWFFPGRNEMDPVNPTALHQSLRLYCKKHSIPLITPHGVRSYYVTKRRSDGVNDTIIAGEIGDTTVSLLQTVYGARPANWTGGKQLYWLPEDAAPAWTSCRLDYGLDYGHKRPAAASRETVAAQGTNPPC